MSIRQPTNNPPLSYADAGVDIDAGNALINAIKPLIASTMRPGTDGSIGGFGGVFDIAATGYKDPLLVAANDGVGTKLKIAIETNRHETIGQDLVAMCVNDLIVQGAEPLFFLDYFATGQLDKGVAQSVISSIADGCRLAGCALTGGETAEMPGMYQRGDYDLAGFSVGAVERHDLLPQSVEAGDMLLGLQSNGLHSNGFSLVRMIVERSGLSWDAKAPFDEEMSLADALLMPTRIYVKSVLQALRRPAGVSASTAASVHALAHITGGGLTENLPRVLPSGLSAEIDCLAWKPSPVFQWLKQVGSVDDAEMLRTFNCGVGMVVVVAAEQVDQVQASLEHSGETVFRMGKLIPGIQEVIYAGSVDWS